MPTAVGALPTRAIVSRTGTSPDPIRIAQRPGAVNGCEVGAVKRRRPPEHRLERSFRRTAARSPAPALAGLDRSDVLAFRSAPRRRTIVMVMARTRGRRPLAERADVAVPSVEAVLGVSMATMHLLDHRGSFWRNRSHRRRRGRLRCSRQSDAHGHSHEGGKRAFHSSLHS